MDGYTLGDLLGVGSSSAVWTGTGPDGVARALKVLHDPADAGTPGGSEPGAPEAATGTADVEGGVLRELGALRRVRHPRVVAVHDIARDGYGRPVLVLDLLAGGSLAALLRHRGRLAVGEVVGLLEALGPALEELHSAGIVHGDLAPGNVLLDAAGEAVLADLGVARALSRRPGSLFATPGFCDPAAVADGRVDAAGDVYGLAAVAWAALTGSAPGTGPRGPGRAELRDSRATLPPGTSAALLDVLREGLHGRPSRRPTPGELATAALACARPRPVRLVAGTRPGAGAGSRPSGVTAPPEVAGDPADDALRSRFAGTRRVDVGPRPVPEPSVTDPSGAASAGTRHGHRSRASVGGGSPRSGRPRVGARRSATGWRPGRAAVVGLAVGAVALGAVGTGAALRNAGGDRPGPSTSAAMGVGTHDAARVAPSPSVSSTTAARGTRTATSGSAPSVSTPSVSTPSVSTPSVSTPSVSTPSVSAGTVSVGTVSAGTVPGDPAAAEVVDEPGRTVLTGSDLTAVVRELAIRRAAVLEAVDETGLSGVDVGGSPALLADAALVAEVRDSGRRYRGLGFDVADVEVETAGPDRAVVLARVATAAHEVVGPEGITTVAATPPTPSRLTLVRVEGEWRISSAG
ncbi:protein kinase [Kineococcus gynurae]|uniref:non-specific serine/threonine protein kinase n=1 Tax=Kineococcus gynurae TaxID=452979 RepID=A0ABV5LUJ3_9ACTN